MVGTNHNHAPIDVCERIWCRQRSILELLTLRIVNKLLYEPTTRLKAHAMNSDAEAYETAIRELFDMGRESEQ
jgi:glutamyl-tRNA reductase